MGIYGRGTRPEAPQIPRPVSPPRGKMPGVPAPTRPGNPFRPTLIFNIFLRVPTSRSRGALPTSYVAIVILEALTSDNALHEFVAPARISNNLLMSLFKCFGLRKELYLNSPFAQKRYILASSSCPK